MDDIRKLLEESRQLLVGKSRVKFEQRRNVLFEIMTGSEYRIYPAVHLWQPNSATLREAMLEYEPENLQGRSESYFVAVHGHPHLDVCGGQKKWNQLCHMAYFKPTGIELEKFNKKWDYLYNANSANTNKSSDSSDRNRTEDNTRERRMGLIDLDFSL